MAKLFLTLLALLGSIAAISRACPVYQIENRLTSTYSTIDHTALSADVSDLAAADTAERRKIDAPVMVAIPLPGASISTIITFGLLVSIMAWKRRFRII